MSVRWSRRRGVTDVKRNPELIVSLTTVPWRISKAHLCLDSLLRQSLKPDRVILWLAEGGHDDGLSIDRGNLPKGLTALMSRGLEIGWCRDIRSYTKIVPTLRAYPDALIVTADDDEFYPRHWLKVLYEAYQKEPEYIHCHRALMIRYDGRGRVLPYSSWDRLWELPDPEVQEPSLDLFPTGVGGVLYGPGHLHSEVLNESSFLSLCPKADDVWLKAMSLLNGVACKKAGTGNIKLNDIRIKNDRDLWTSNVTENDGQIQAVSQRYGVFFPQNSRCPEEPPQDTNPRSK